MKRLAAKLILVVAVLIIAAILIGATIIQPKLLIVWGMLAGCAAVVWAIIELEAGDG